MQRAPPNRLGVIGMPPALAGGLSRVAVRLEAIVDVGDGLTAAAEPAAAPAAAVSGDSRGQRLHMRST